MISLVIPVFNGARTIYQCLESVFGQGIAVEVIVCDGASKDNTLEVIQKFVNEHKVELKIISEPDSGAANAIMKGFKIATGEVFGWLGSDDFLQHNTLQIVTEFFSQNPESSWLVGECQRIWPNGNETITKPNEVDFAKLLLVNPIDQPSSFWRKSLYEEVGGVNETYEFAFDWDLWCRFKNAGYKPHFVSEVLSTYNFSDDNLTSRGGFDQLEEQLRVIGNYNSQTLANYFRYIFHAFDLAGFFDGQKNSERLILKYKLTRLFGKFLFGTKSRHYSLYWLSKQMRGLDVIDREVNSKLAVVTAADTNYFPSLLSLIGTLKYFPVTSNLSVKLIIWNLGLNTNQVNLLKLIDFPLEVKCLSDFYPEPFDGAFSPIDDCFAWKSYCILHPLLAGETHLLWMDAGSAVSGNLDFVFKEIDSKGHFLLEHKEFTNRFLTSKTATIKLALSEVEKDESQLSSTVLGFKNTHDNIKLLESWKILSSDPELILGDLSEHRHDQSLLSILTSRAKMSRYAVNDFAGENYSDLAKAKSMGLTFIFHRRKWEYIDLASLVNPWKL